MCQHPLTLLNTCTLLSRAGSLATNELCGLYYLYYEHGCRVELQGTYNAEGITALCDGLKGSAITWLRCVVTPRVSAFPVSAPVDTRLLSDCPHYFLQSRLQ